MKAKFSGPDDLDGFEDLREEDQERVRSAWVDGRVADEDIPPTARKPADAANGEDDEEKPKKKRAPAKKKAEVEGDEEEKPKRKRATKPKRTDEEAEDEAEDTEEKPKSAPAKKSRAKVRTVTHLLSVVFTYLSRNVRERKVQRNQKRPLDGKLLFKEAPRREKLPRSDTINSRK